MQFLKKMFGKHQKSSGGTTIEKNQKSFKQSRTNTEVNQDCLEDVMAFAREQIELAKNNR